jgi:hypothetical protein
MTMGDGRNVRPHPFRHRRMVSITPGCALAPGKGPPVPIVQEVRWAPNSVLTQRLEEKSFSVCLGSNLNRPVIQPVARHYID